MAVAKIYNSQTGQWEAVIVGATGDDGVVQSATEPSNTDQLWLDTDDTAEPLAIPAGGAAGQILQKSTDSDYDTAWSNVPSHNYIINGAFDIWQRGTSFTAGSRTYTADRWVVGRSGNDPGATITQSSDTPDNFDYALKVQRDSGDTNVRDTYAVQNFETAGRELAGKEVTLSFYAKLGADADSITVRARTHSGSPSSTIYSSGGLFSGSNPNLDSPLGEVLSATTNWSRFTRTFTFASDANAMQVSFELDTSNSSAASDESMYIAGVQLEAGSVATPFKRNANSIQGELAACQRYYASVGGGLVGRFYNYSASNANVTIPSLLPTTMRVIPTMTASIDVNDGTPASPTAIFANNKSHFFVQQNNVSSGQFVDLREFTASAEL